MPRKTPTIENLLWLYMLLLIGAYTAFSWVVPPIMFSDPAWGFLTWESMKNGADFNLIRTSNFNDISRDYLSFLSWWSPGQYLVPAVFEKLGLSLGKASVITTAVFSLLGLVGYHKFLRALKFSHRTSTLSAAVIASTATFSIAFGIYTGGTVLIFGAVPWILLMCVMLRENKLWAVPLFVAVFLIGAFFKHAFAITALAAVVSLFLYQYFNQQKFDIRALFFHGLKLFVSFAVFYGILHFFYLSLNLSPAFDTTTKYPATILQKLLSGYAGIILSPLSIGELLMQMRLKEWVYAVNLGSHNTLVLILTVLIGLMLVWRILKTNNKTLYKSFLLGFLLTFTVVFTYFFLFDKHVSRDDRHFLAAGMILLPGIIELLRGLKTRPLKLFGYSIILIFCVYGISIFFMQLATNRDADNIGRHGFTLSTISKRGLSLLGGLDANIPPGNNLFIVSWPQVALEVKRNRVLVVNPVLTQGSGQKKPRLKGRADNIFIFLEAEVLKEGNAGSYFRSFEDYDPSSWHSITLDSLKDKTFVLYYQGKYARGLDQLKGQFER